MTPRFESRSRCAAGAPRLTHLLCAVLALALACDHGHDHPTEVASAPPELPGGSVTLWTEKTELFMEYPALVVGMPDKFLVHLTALSDFSPLRSGSVRLVFEPQDGGEGFSVTQETPRAPGIYGPIPDFPRPGLWTLRLVIDSPQLQDTLEVPDLRVYASAADVPPETESGEAPGIGFLKEQQWKTPQFRTAFAREDSVAARIDATGELIAVPGRSAQITAPVAGWLDASGLPSPLAPGQRVEAGQTLAFLVPALGEGGSAVAQARRALREAEEEHARAERLVRAEAIPERRLHEAKIQLDAAREAIAGLGEGGAALPGKRVAIRSPIAGAVTQIDLQLGRRVEAGAPLLGVLDPSALWLRIDVAADVAPRIAVDASASFQVEGLPRSYDASQLISIGSIIDARTRTVPIWFEVENPDGTLKVGSHARAAVQTGEPLRGVVIPSSAVLDEDGQPIAYVQAEGESFHKRALQLGGGDRESALVLSGIEAGERVVTGAAYQVRLASLSTAVPAHGHEH
jgi:cobalt-zinc-cadmium efflux system membrane fusion protein